MHSIADSRLPLGNNIYLESKLYITTLAQMLMASSSELTSVVNKFAYQWIEHHQSVISSILIEKQKIITDLKQNGHEEDAIQATANLLNTLIPTYYPISNSIDIYLLSSFKFKQEGENNKVFYQEIAMMLKAEYQALTLTDPFYLEEVYQSFFKPYQERRIDQTNFIRLINEDRVIN